jgi:hypothetical protein
VTNNYFVRIKYRGGIITRANKNNTRIHKYKLQTKRKEDTAVKKE